MRWQLALVVTVELIALAAVIVLSRRRIQQWRVRRAMAAAQPFASRSRRLAVSLIGAIVTALFVVPIGGSAYAIGDCKDAPRVERPTYGLVSTVDSRVAAVDSANKPVQGTAGTPYGDYGYAGLTWQTYDLGCGGDARDPVTAATTWAANQLFNVAKFEVAIFNGLHYALLDNNSFDWLDRLTTSISSTLFGGIFTPWIGFVLLILAVMLFGYAARSDLAGLSRRASWAIIALTFAASAAATPLVFETFVRSTVVDLSNDAANGLLQTSDAHNGVPDYLVNDIIYPAWQKGQFGATDNTAAKTYSATLLAAKACSKVEDKAKCDTDSKKKAFGSVASDIGDKSGDGGDAYHVLQGRSDTRISASAQALLSATIATSFQVVALLILALSILTVAIMVLLGAAIGLLAVLNPDTMRGIFRVFGTALINAVIMAIFAGLHARIVLWVTSQSNIPWILQEVGLALVTVLMLIIAQPIKRAKAMLRGVLDTVGGTSSTSGLLGRRDSDKQATPSQEYWQKQRENDYQDAHPTGPQHQRDQSVPEEHSNSIGHMSAGSADGNRMADQSEGGSGGTQQAIGWAANATPQGQAVLVAAQAGHELQGSLADHARPEPEAESPGVSEGMARGPVAAIGPSSSAADDWYRPEQSDSGPDAAPTVQQHDGTAYVITEAPAVEDPYVPDRSEVNQPAELHAVGSDGPL
jgi:hypothetical protein